MPAVSAYRFSSRVFQHVMLAVGLLALAASAFIDSYMLAFIGLGLTFWGTLLLNISGSKYVKLEILTATASSALVDLEKVLLATGSKEKGIYLPPKNLTDYTSSLVFIPSKPSESLPEQKGTDGETLCSENSGGTLLTPPGLGLSRLFEKKLGKQFTEIDLSHLQRDLPRLFDELEITKNMFIQAEGNNVTVEVKNHIFRDLCQETRKLKKTHETVGCPLASAIACALAKSTGKPVTIENETEDQEDTTRIQYKILEE
jgi:hypothetical protein